MAQALRREAGLVMAPVTSRVQPFRRSEPLYVCLPISLLSLPVNSFDLLFPFAFFGPLVLSLAVRLAH